jgi:hypothetical protein
MTPGYERLSVVTVAEVIDSVSGLVSAGAACLAPFVGLVGALFGTFLGARLERKASAEARRAEQVERDVRERTGCVEDWLHHASVVAGLQTEITRIGIEGFDKLGVSEAYLQSIREATMLSGPALLQGLTSARRSLLAAVEAASDGGKEVPHVAAVVSSCFDDLATAKARLDSIKKQVLHQRDQ